MEEPKCINIQRVQNDDGTETIFGASVRDRPDAGGVSSGSAFVISGTGETWVALQDQDWDFREWVQTAFARPAASPAAGTPLPGAPASPEAFDELRGLLRDLLREQTKTQQALEALVALLDERRTAKSSLGLHQGRAPLRDGHFSRMYAGDAPPVDRMPSVVFVASDVALAREFAHWCAAALGVAPVRCIDLTEEHPRISEPGEVPRTFYFTTPGPLPLSPQGLVQARRSADDVLTWELQQPRRSESGMRFETTHWGVVAPTTGRGSAR